MPTPNELEHQAERKELNKSYIFIGVFLLLGALVWFLWVPWDRRGGTYFIRLMFWGDVLAGFAFLAYGMLRKN